MNASVLVDHIFYTRHFSYRKVPNSLGPGELLQHYGTEKQKN